MGPAEHSRKDNPQLMCALSTAQKGADPDRFTGASSMEEKRKDLPALMHHFWFILSLC